MRQEVIRCREVLRGQSRRGKREGEKGEMNVNRFCLCVGEVYASLSTVAGCQRQKVQAALFGTFF